MANQNGSPSPGLLTDHLKALARELRELGRDHLELATLETRLVVNTALRMVIVGIVTALMLASAWLSLVGAAALWLISIGLQPALALLILSVANVFLALVGWQYIKHLNQGLGWPATERSMADTAAAKAEGGTA